MAQDSEGKLVALSHRHEMLLNWLVLNPDKTLRECADHFGWTQSWLSSIIHSDIFQSALKQKQLDIALRVAGSIPEKLRAAADIGVEKLSSALEKSEDPEFILDATDKILHRMGYAPQSARNPAGSPVNIQNNFVIGAQDLLDAQSVMAQAARGALPVIEGEALPQEPAA